MPEIAARLTEELVTLHAKITENPLFPSPSGQTVGLLGRITEMEGSTGAGVSASGPQLPPIASLQREATREAGQRNSRAMSLPPIMPEHMGEQGQGGMSEDQKPESLSPEQRPVERRPAEPQSIERLLNNQSEYPRHLGDGLPQYQPFW